METAGAPAPFIFSSSEGYALCRSILRPLLPYDPHDYQLEGICNALDGVDVLAILPTGSGKTGFLSMFLLVVRALVNDPSLCPRARKFPKNPAILVICPTNYIEHQIVRDQTIDELYPPLILVNLGRKYAKVRLECIGHQWRHPVGKSSSGRRFMG